MPSARRYSRLARVNEVLREVIADELERVDDEDLDLVTITGVSTDPDLRHATVWFSALTAQGEGEGEGAGRPAEASLSRHRVRLQGAIGRQVRLKRTPELAFRPDPAISSGRKVEEVLRQVRKNEDMGGAPGD